MRAAFPGGAGALNHDGEWLVELAGTGRKIAHQGIGFFPDHTTATKVSQDAVARRSGRVFHRQADHQRRKRSG